MGAPISRLIQHVNPARGLSVSARSDLAPSLSPQKKLRPGTVRRSPQEIHLDTGLVVINWASLKIWTECGGDGSRSSRITPELNHRANRAGQGMSVPAGKYGFLSPLYG